jgi:antitoxin HicB
MVALHGWKMGRKQPRASRDADILVNARVVSNGTERVSEALLSRGFSLDGVSPEGLGHRFLNGQVRFDVLGPDGVGSRTGLFRSAVTSLSSCPLSTIPIHWKEGSQEVNAGGSAVIRSFPIPVAPVIEESHTPLMRQLSFDDFHEWDDASRPMVHGQNLRGARPTSPLPVHFFAGTDSYRISSNKFELTVLISDGVGLTFFSQEH